MKKSPIIMNAANHAELTVAIEAIGRLSERGRSEMTGLRGELARAQIVAPQEVPPGVITMNSRAELLDLDTNESMEFTLVFPSESNIEEGRISVLAPLGAAMLGYRVGDEFEWVVPYGLRRLRVIAVVSKQKPVLRSLREVSSWNEEPSVDGRSVSLARPSLPRLAL
jgi:regulator of nucleoside diphosphate kinase